MSSFCATGKNSDWETKCSSWWKNIITAHKEHGCKQSCMWWSFSWMDIEGGAMSWWKRDKSGDKDGDGWLLGDGVCVCCLLKRVCFNEAGTEDILSLSAQRHVHAWTHNPGLYPPKQWTLRLSHVAQGLDRDMWHTWTWNSRGSFNCKSRWMCELRGVTVINLDRGSETVRRKISRAGRHSSAERSRQENRKQWERPHAASSVRENTWTRVHRLQGLTELTLVTLTPQGHSTHTETHTFKSPAATYNNEPNLHWSDCDCTIQPKNKILDFSNHDWFGF